MMNHEGYGQPSAARTFLGDNCTESEVTQLEEVARRLNDIETTLMMAEGHIADFFAAANGGMRDVSVATASGPCAPDSSGFPGISVKLDRILKLASITRERASDLRRIA